MTLRSRNFLIGFIFLLICACLGVFIFIVIRIDFTAANIGQVILEGQARYLHFAWNLSTQTPYINLISPAISIILAWIVSAVFLRYFRKVTSPQLFFLVLFWVSMGMEIVRSLNLMVIENEANLAIQLVFTRLAIMGRLFGSMALFAASLYMVGTKLKHQEMILIIIAFLSVCLASLIPIDTLRIGQDLLFLPAEGYSLDILRLVTGILTILNFIKYTISSNESGNYMLVVAVFFLIAGLELQYMATEWIMTTLSWVLLIAGTGWMGRRFITNYMWY